MDHDSPVLDSDTLRQQLMSHLPMQRIKALHVFEVEPANGATPEHVAAAAAAARFAARGIPFYSAQDTSYLAWVDKAVTLWQRVQDTVAYAPAVSKFARTGAARHA